MNAKKIIKILLILGLIAGLAFGILAAYLYTHQEKLLNPVVAEINKSLLVPVQVKKMGLSLRKFPNASLRFQEVYCLEAVEGVADTLFVLDDFFVQLSLWDMLRGKYVIKKLSLERGILNLKLFNNGKDNFSIVKPSEAESSAQLSLQSISLKDVYVHFWEEESKFTTQQYLKSAELSGDFSGEITQLRGELDARNMSIKLPGLQYENPLAYGGKFSLDLAGDVFNLESPRFLFNGEKASLLIHLEEGDKRVLIKGQELSLQKILDILPYDYQNHLAGLQAQGSLQLSLLLAENPWKEWGVQSSFEWKAKKTHFTQKNIELGESYLKGRFENNANKGKSKGELILERFEIQQGTSNYQGAFSVSNFETPYLTLAAKFATTAQELNQLNPIEGLEQLQGKVVGEVSFENQFRNLSNPTHADLARAKTSGFVQVEELKFAVEQNPVHIPQGRFTWQGNTLEIAPTKIFNGKNDLELQGKLQNFLAYLLIDQEVLDIQGSLKSNYLNPEKWFKEKGEQAKASDEYRFTLPNNLRLNLELSAEKLEFDRFQSERIGFSLLLDRQKLTLKNLRAQSMDGSLLAQVELHANKHPIEVKILGEADKLELQKVFYTFYNFGQQTLTEKEISGRLGGDFEVTFKMDSLLNIDLKSLTALINAQLLKGRLVNFEPMNALSRFARVEELADIRFSELSNQIRIQNERILIPRMKIKSNVMELDLAGTHTFNNDIDYQLGLQLRDVLYAQRKKKISELDDLVYEEDEGGAMLFVRMTGTVDNPILNLDKSRYREKIKSDWKENINPFKKPVEDTLKKPKPKYKIEWDEE